MMPYLLGIFRERQHSPGREFDDTEILRLVAKHVEAAGYQVHLTTPEDPGGGVDDPIPSLVFLMCERMAALERLEPLERSGIPHVNSLRGVLNTYRDRMIPLLAASRIPIPKSRIISSDPSGLGDLSLSLEGAVFPIWIKRADVHNTQSGDVELIPSPEQFQIALAALHDRGISRVVAQQHIPGDLIKFYGIGMPHAGDDKDTWFRWFYHRDQELARYPFSEEALRALTQQAAAAIGLEVYGGDAIITPTGEIFLIDINAWPSFALFREEAAARIAAWLLYRVRKGTVQ